MGKGDRRSSRSKAGGQSFTFLNNEGSLQWGFAISSTVVQILVAATAILALVFASIAFHHANSNNSEINDIKHEALNIWVEVDFDGLADDDDGTISTDGEDDDDDDGHILHDHALHHLLIAGQNNFIDGTDSHGNAVVGHLHLNGVPLRIIDEVLTVEGGDVTADCVRTRIKRVIAADSADIEVGDVIGATPTGEASLGFAHYEEQLVADVIDSDSIDVFGISDSEAVYIYESAAAGTLDLRLGSIAADGVVTLTPAVTVDPTVYSIGGECLFFGAPTNTPDSFMIVWVEPAGTDGINAQLFKITSAGDELTAPTFTTSAVDVFNAGVTSNPQFLVTGPGNTMVMGFVEVGGAGASLLAYDVNVGLTTITPGAPVVVEATVDGSGCGLMCGDVRGSSVITVTGETGTLDPTGEVFGITAVTTLTSLAPGVALYDGDDDDGIVFDCVAIGTNEFLVSIIDTSSNVYGELNLFEIVGTAFSVPAIETQAFNPYDGVADVSGHTPTADLAAYSDTGAVVVFRSASQCSYSTVAQAWEMSIVGGAATLTPGDWSAFTPNPEFDTAVSAFGSSGNVAIIYGSDENSGLGSRRVVYGVSGILDAQNNIRFVHSSPAVVLGVADSAGVAGETIDIITSGCVTNPNWDFPERRVFFHGDGSVRTSGHSDPNLADNYRAVGAGFAQTPTTIQFDRFESSHQNHCV